MALGKWTRRGLLTAGGLLGGGLLLGVGTLAFAPNRLRIAPDQPLPEGAARLTTWLQIHSDGRIVVLAPHCEMGQGALTGLALLLAEELDADWAQVRIEEAPALDEYANGYMLRSFMLAEGGTALPQWLVRGVDYATYKVGDLLGLQVTGGSASLRATGQFGMRIAGATARQMLRRAAAAAWKVPLAEVTTGASVLTHAPSGRSAGYGELAAAAAAIEPELHPTLKPRSEWRLAGTARPRADLPSKVDGSAIYGIDVQLPGMLHAAVRGAPVQGGKLLGVEHAAALAVPGVRRVVELEDAVAVVAQSWWRAEQAVRALDPRFDDGGHGAVDSAGLLAEHRRVLGDGPALDGTMAAALVEAEYQVPYLAHATMEPPAATVRFSADGASCEVWAGTQDPLNARHAAAKAAGLGVAAVRFHNQQVGGGYGRRLPFCFDWIDQAVRIAKALAPAPVKLIWSREQDLAHDYYRPAAVARYRGALDAKGGVAEWASHCTGPADMGSAEPPYAVARRSIQASTAPGHLRAGSWRSVAFSQQGFFVESFVDELAAAAKVDPYAFRLGLLADRPRHRAVLEAVARLSGWESGPPEGHGRGIALVESFGTICAQVAEVRIVDGRIRVTRICAAVDCGTVVEPNQALAQVQGGIVFGLSAALLQQITLKDGAVQQRSFPDFPSLTLAEVPRIEVAFIESGAALGGLGEPGVPPVAPAVANAVHALTGQRLRVLPLRLADSSAVPEPGAAAPA